MAPRSPRDPTICPTDDEAIVPRAALNKQSWEYVIKSGVAGGLAGCAVRFSLLNTTR
jgi:solute carrier family 25 protein 16